MERMRLIGLLRQISFAQVEPISRLAVFQADDVGCLGIRRHGACLLKHADRCVALLDRGEHEEPRRARDTQPRDQ